MSQGQVLFYQGCHGVRQGKRGALPDKANVGRCTYQATPRAPVLSHEEQADGLPRISLGRRELECCSTLDEPQNKGRGAAWCFEGEGNKKGKRPSSKQTALNDSTNRHSRLERGHESFLEGTQQQLAKGLHGSMTHLWSSTSSQGCVGRTQSSVNAKLAGGDVKHEKCVRATETSKRWASEPSQASLLCILVGP